MRFLQGNDIFHEKMTFGYRFVHACCIHTHIVGNAPDRKQVFRDRKQQRFNAYQGRIETLNGIFSSLRPGFYNSIEVVSSGTYGL